MKCYKHIEMDAVAQCTDCSRWICSECEKLFNPPTCDVCMLQGLAQEKKAFIKTLALAIGLFVVSFLLYQNPDVSFFGRLFTAYMIAGIPFGWNLATRITPNILLSLPWIIYLPFKLVFSIFAGIVMTPYKIYQAVTGLKQAKEVETTIVSSK